MYKKNVLSWHWKVGCFTSLSWFCVYFNTHLIHADHSFTITVQDNWNLYWYLQGNLRNILGTTGHSLQLKVSVCLQSPFRFNATVLKGTDVPFSSTWPVHTCARVRRGPGWWILWYPVGEPVASWTSSGMAESGRVTSAKNGEQGKRTTHNCSVFICEQAAA